MNLRELLNRTGEHKAAVVGWGRGMGHKGHMYLASSVITQAKETGADPYFVLSRSVGKDNPLQPEEKLAIYKKIFPHHGQIFHVATEEMPDLTRVLRKLNEMGYTACTVVVGAAEVNALSYVKNYNGVADKVGNIPFNFTDGLQVISRQETNDPSKDEEGPRATPMRDILMDPNATENQKFAIWRDAMNPEISDDEVRDLMHKAEQRMKDFAKPKAKKTKNTEVTETVNIKQANQRVREMRAQEFMRKNLAEGDVPYAGKGAEELNHVHVQALKNAMSIPNISMNKANGSPYMQYRFGMAMANPDMPRAGAMSGDPLITAYTDADMQKVKDAAKSIGAGAITHLSDGVSNEADGGNTTSPVAKPKKNKYGV
jgi:hypothetical protein